MEKTFEQKMYTQGVTNFTCLVEIARQMKRIADALNKKDEKEKDNE